MPHIPQLSTVYHRNGITFRIEAGYNVSMRTRSQKREAMLATLFFVVAVYAYAPLLHAQEAVPTASTSSTETVIPVTREEDTPLYSVTPVVANEKAKPRDIIKKELVITNNTNQRIDLYITVENVDPQKGVQGFEGPTEGDLSRSLANWVEITRGVIELGPQESRKIPYLIHVNLTAQPGSYFSEIRFRNGHTRADAESREGGTVLMLNLEVLDDAMEKLQLGTFSTDDSVIMGESVGFSYLLENIGNRDIEPRGSIRIFNRKGEEVGSIPLNADGIEIAPDNKEQLASAWSAAGRFGKYKAFLDLEYGENQLASVQDTVYFWVFPWKEIIAALIGVLVLAVIGTFIIHMRAMAQPRPAYAVRDNTPTDPQAYYPQASRQQRYAPSPQDLQKTVLLRHNERGLEQAGRQSVQAPAQRHGETVTLSPRSRHSATTRGSTVELKSRR